MTWEMMPWTHHQEEGEDSRLTTQMNTLDPYVEVPQMCLMGQEIRWTPSSRLSDFIGPSISVTSP
jgi:hypothetical protein